MRRHESFTAVLALGVALAARAQSGDVETIEVVGTTPLGAEIDPDRIAGNVQTATAKQIREQGALDLSDFMRRTLASVFVNEAQSNPLQPDVQYRGFVGSPLLGLPQGLAVYQDGVRINEPFGDTVNWALLPEAAIDSIRLMPGSNPLFGLNALGGALAVETKNGFRNPGTRAELLAGSFGRTELQGETGGTVGDRLGYFVTASHLEEDGWRDYSPTKATQLFADVSTKTDRSTFDVSINHADTDLIGNGPVPIDLLEIDRHAIFTRPDRTENSLSMLNVRATRQLPRGIALTGNVYVRKSDVSTLNGDDSDYEACEDLPNLLCLDEDDEEEVVLDENGAPVEARDEVEGATVNRTHTDQRSLGFGFQAGWTGAGKYRNRLTIGLAHDESDADFTQSTELGSLDATRLAVPAGVFVGGSFTSLDASMRNTGLYVTDTFLLGARAAVTLSGRYNRTEVDLSDRLGDALNGEHAFDRFNPAAGITYRLNDAFGFYASYSEASRVPSPVELTCADEIAPCRLPNAFLSDPPLSQVVAKTVEAGVRGRFRGGEWHATVFRTTNEDDILFISAGELTNQGFFTNVGDTRRQGFELELAGDVGERTSWFADFTTLDATFREHFAVASPNNPGAVDGEIEVETGSRLPLVPDRLFKAGLRFAASDKLVVGADVLSSAGAPYRGDEANLIEPLGGYTLLNFRFEYRLRDHVRLFANVDNVLDEEYATFGLFGEADEVLGDDFEDPRFVGPGAPRAGWIGVRIEF